MEELIGTRQAAEMLNVTSVYIRMLCKEENVKDKLMARKMGRDWFFEKNKVLEIVEKMRKEKRSLKSFLN